jgi:hypothetical protein
MTQFQTSGRDHLRDSRIERAMSVLSFDPAFHHVTQLTNNGTYKNNILEALGKLGTEQEIRMLASEICRTQANTATALRLIKGNHGHWSPGRKEALTANLVREVGHYRAQHPGVTVEVVEEALEDAKNQIRMTMLDLPFLPGHVKPSLPSGVRERREARARELKARRTALADQVRSERKPPAGAMTPPLASRIAGRAAGASGADT